jgi:hypothetical protein
MRSVDSAVAILDLAGNWTRLEALRPPEAQDVQQKLVQENLMKTSGIMAKFQLAQNLS